MKIICRSCGKDITKEKCISCKTNLMANSIIVCTDKGHFSSSFCVVEYMETNTFKKAKWSEAIKID